MRYSMRRLISVIALLSLATLACSTLLGSQPTTPPNAFETAAASTLTALVPTATATATTEPPTNTPEATASPTAVPAATCSVVYADGANLFCLGPDGTPQVLATAPGGQQVSGPGISPDGQLVAYFVGEL